MDSPSWIAGHLTGGLGNRLFQHAAAAGLAEKWGIPLVFYIPDCTETGHGAFENIFKLFPSVARVTKKVSISRLPETPGAVFRFEGFPASPPSPFTTVDGYRQTELYFPSKGLQPNFREAIGSERCEALLKRYQLQTKEERVTTWFVHVRLGDYKILPHHQIDLGLYYSSAVKHIPSESRVLLFSDESQQYGSTLERFFSSLGISVQTVQESDELASLFLMSHCWGGAVVANSTFSWWGAYFAKQQSPETLYKAVYPSVWGHGLPEAKDIVPSWGIRIENRKN